MAQNTRNEARICLLGVWTMAGHILGSNPPPKKIAKNKQKIGHFMREVNDNEE